MTEFWPLKHEGKPLVETSQRVYPLFSFFKNEVMAHFLPLGIEAMKGSQLEENERETEK